MEAFQNMKSILENPLNSVQPELNLSLEGNLGLDDLVPCYMHELPYQRECQQICEKERNSRAIVTPREENLDNIYVQVKGSKEDYGIEFSGFQEDIEINISPAWLQDQIKPLRCNKPSTLNTEDSQNQLTAITQMNQEEDLITKLQRDDKKVLTGSNESSDIQMGDENNENAAIEQKVKVSLTEQSKMDQSLENPKVVNSSSKASTPKGEDSCDQKKTSDDCSNDAEDPAKSGQSKALLSKKKLRLHKKIEISVRKEITQRQMGKPTRKRTKLKSSGESSSSEPMDLAKRRDVVNKTILRVVRRYFTSKFKATIDMKYGNPSDTQDRYFQNITTFAKTFFGSDDQVNLKEISFYLASIIEPKYMKEEDILDCGYTKEDFLVYHYCLYRYSHTRLVNLFEFQPIRFLYEHFYNQGRDEVIMNEPAMVKNKDLYSQVMLEFKNPQHFLKPLT